MKGYPILRRQPEMKAGLNTIIYANLKPL